MGGSGRVGWVALALVGSMWAGTAEATEQAAGPTVSLRWALGALDTTSPTPSAVQRDTRLASGTKLKFLVEPTAPASVYLILQDSDADLHVLYRESAPKAATGVSEPTYVPPGGQWFELEDGAGSETFFLLASAEPLATLDSLLDRHEAATPESRKGLTEEIVAEIRQLQKAHRNFARPVERPVMIGGQTRNTVTAAAAIDRLAVEVEAERFYSKTITIDH